MIRKILPVFLFSALACAQGVIVGPQTALKTVNGITAPVANATITVCGPNASGIPCSPALVGVLFKDVALTQPLSNPFTADANGNYSFAIAAGTYTVTVTAPGYAGFSYQTSNLSAGITGVTSGQGLQITGSTVGLLPCPVNDILQSTGTGYQCGTTGGLGNVSTAPSGAQTIVQPASGGSSTAFSANNLANIRLVTSSWNWSQSPSDVLTSPGSVTIHLSPCPLGIDTASASNNYVYEVYISNTGTPEAAVPTGGSCTPGAASGTIVVTTQYGHPAGYKVGSASSGIQEAWNDAWVNDVGAAPNASSQAAPSVKLAANTVYTIYSTVYLRGRGGVLDGNGALISCATRDRCIYVGTTNAHPAVNYHKLYTLHMGSQLCAVTIGSCAGNAAMAGVNISGVSATGGTWTISTTQTVPFLALNNAGQPDTVACEIHSNNYDGSFVAPVASVSTNSFTVSLSGSISSSTYAFGYCALLAAAVEDNSDHVTFQDFQLFNSSPISTGEFNFGIVNDNDQHMVVERATNRSSCSINPCEGSGLQLSTWPIGAFVYQRGDQGLAGITYLHNAEFSNINCFTGSGGGLVFSDSICQAFPMFSVRYFGGLQPATIENVYNETGGGSISPLYPAGVVGSVGYVLGGGSIGGGSRMVGNFPTSGQYATFTTTGGSTSCSQENYFVVAHNGSSQTSGVMYIGQSPASPLCGASTTLWWPSLRQVDVTGTSAGTITYDILRTQGTSGTAAPYGTGNASLTTSLSQNSACGTTGMCSYSTTINASTSSYSVATTTWQPTFYFWPTTFAINQCPLHVDLVASNASAVAACGSVGVAVVASRLGAYGNAYQRSTVLTEAPAPDPGYAQLIYQLNTGGSGPVANSKGALNFGQTLPTFPLDVVTIEDSNFAKTAATGGHRPLNDAADLAIGKDQAGGIYQRANTSVSEYLGVQPSGSNWTRRLTAAQEQLTVPIVSAGQGPGVNNNCWVDGKTNVNSAACATTFEVTNAQRSGTIISTTNEDITSNPWPVNFAPDWTVPTGLHASTCDSTHVNCIVLEAPMILLPGSTITGAGSLVVNGGSLTELSAGSAIVTGNNFPPPVGAPLNYGSGGLAPVCNGSAGSINTFYVYVRVANNLQTHAGAPAVAGPGMHTPEITVNCTAATSVTFPIPSAVGNSPFQAQDFQIAASTVSGGEQWMARDTTNLSCSPSNVSTFNGVDYGCSMAGTAATLNTVPVGGTIATPCSVLCTRQFQHTDLSNPGIVINPNQTVAFATQITGVALVCGPINSASGYNVPNWMIWNQSGEELTGVSSKGMSIQTYGNSGCGGYNNGSLTPNNSGTGATGGSSTAFSGGYIFEDTETPNGTLEHMQLGGGPSTSSATAPFYPIFLDGDYDSRGGAAGVPRKLDDITVTPKSAGAYSPAAIYAEGPRTRVVFSNIHIENNTPTSGCSTTVCFGLTAATGITCDNGAWCLLLGVEGQTSTTGTLVNATSTAQFVHGQGLCQIGTATASQGRCLGNGQNSSAGTFIDQTVFPTRRVTGYIENFASGTSMFLTSAYTNATTTPTTIMSFPVQASGTSGGGSSFTVHCHGLYKAATSGYFGLTVTGPASPVTVTYDFRKGTSLAANALGELDYPATGAAFPTSLGMTAVTTAATDMPWDFTQQVVMGTASGTIALQGFTVSTDTLTIEPGSSCHVLP